MYSRCVVGGVGGDGGGRGLVGDLLVVKMLGVLDW